MDVNVGVVVPHSKTYPTMGKEYMNGLKLGVKRSIDSYSFIVEGIGLGADEKVILDKAQKFIVQDDVHVITGLMGHVGISELEEYAKNMEVVLLYSDLGASIPRLNQENDWSFCNSFELYKSAMLFGEYAPHWGYETIAISSCYYDSGYGLSQALEKSLYKSEGKFAGHFITPLTPRENESELISDFVNDVKPDAVFAIHSGIYAKEHAAFSSENKIPEKIPFYSTAFGLDGMVIGEDESAFVGSKCISPWFVEEENKSNLEFVEAYQKEYGKSPTPFALLGYENGLMLDKATQNLTGDQVSTNHLRKVLGEVSTIGPRGRVSFDSETNHTSFPHYLWEVVKKKDAYKKEKKEDVNLELTRPVFNDSVEQVRGWTNAYLCG